MYKTGSKRRKKSKIQKFPFEMRGLLQQKQPVVIYLACCKRRARYYVGKWSYAIVWQSFHSIPVYLHHLFETISMTKISCILSWENYYFLINSVEKWWGELEEVLEDLQSQGRIVLHLIIMSLLYQTLGDWSTHLCNCPPDSVLWKLI